jgi:hypothetical protein
MSRYGLQVPLDNMRAGFVSYSGYVLTYCKIQYCNLIQL